MAANDRVASVLETVFPDRTVAAVRSTGPSWNERNRTVGIEFADREEIYLKIATDRDGSRIARERAAITYVGARDDIPVSVPEIVASEIEGTVPYLATAPMAGEPLIDAWAEADEASDADDAERTELTRAVGRRWRAFTTAASPTTATSSAATPRASTSIRGRGPQCSRRRSPNSGFSHRPIGSTSISIG
jgi:hypothetical protein